MPEQENSPAAETSTPAAPDLTELCQELHNWFVRSDADKHVGTFTIANGNITADFLLPNQYFRIMGSVFSDGVYRYPAADLPDETFDGAVWALAIPQPVIKLAQEIQAWRAKYENADSAAMSPFNSESFGGYSYAKSGAGGATSSRATGWQGVFRSQLNRWRKLQ